MKLILSLLKKDKPKAFEMQAKQFFQPEDINAADQLRVWKMEEFPSITYQLVGQQGRQIACHVEFDAKDFVFRESKPHETKRKYPKKRRRKGRS